MSLQPKPCPDPHPFVRTLSAFECSCIEACRGGFEGSFTDSFFSVGNFVLPSVVLTNLDTPTTDPLCFGCQFFVRFTC